MRYSTFYILGAGWTVLSRSSGGGGVSAQTDDLNAPTTSSPTAAPPDLNECAGYLPHVKDGYCDDELNVADCGYDGGDCCACTCVDGVVHTCGETVTGYDCKDPAVPEGCGETPSPAAIFGFPDCKGYMYNLQNGYCNDDLNNAECGYDGGDCCSVYDYTSIADDDYFNNCGNYGYDCQDPNAPTDCETDSPNPSPTVNPDHQYCKGVTSSISNGFCDSYNNNEECDFDGGDCCPCTCERVYYYCGPYYDCLDPEAQCTTSSTYAGYSSSSSSYSSTSSTYADYYSSSSSYSSTSTSSDDDFNYDDDDDYEYDDDDSVPSDDDACAGRAFGGNSCCTREYNTPECDYDGGDCCECTCIDSDNFGCGVAGYDCLDPVCDSFPTSYGDDADIAAGAAPVDPSSSPSASSGEVLGLVSVAILAFCCFGGLMSFGCGAALRMCGVWKPAGKSNSYAVPAAPAVAPRAPMIVRLPPIAPTHEESKHTEANSDRGSYGAATVHRDRQLAAHLQQYESATSRREDRQIEAAITERSVREQTIAETMYQRSKASSATAIDERRRTHGGGVHVERQSTSGSDADIVGVEECKVPEIKETPAIGENEVAVTDGRRSDDDEQGNDRDIETGSSVMTGRGYVLTEASSDEESNTDDTETGLAPETNSEHAPPSDEGTHEVVGDVRGHEEGDPPGDTIIEEERSSDAADVVDVVVSDATIGGVPLGSDVSD